MCVSGPWHWKHDGRQYPAYACRRALPHLFCPNNTQKLVARRTAQHHPRGYGRIEVTRVTGALSCQLVGWWRTVATQMCDTQTGFCFAATTNLCQQRHSAP